MVKLENGQQGQKEIVKRTIKDSVFTNLFKETKYLIQLYQALHPEDKEITENDIKDITINNVLVDDIYNDLGFLAGNKLLILIEAQSTWTVNILFRVLMYLVQTYREYFQTTGQDIYNSTKLKMPKPELYVIYTGDRKEHPKEISFSEEFFGGEEICVDVKVQIIYDGKKGDIINQYVAFTKVCKEQTTIHGRSRKGIQEAIRICKNRNVLLEYLEIKEKEVVDMMMELYDQEEVMRSYIKSKEYDTKVETAKRMIEKGKLTIKDIAEYSNLPIEIVKELADDLQLV